VTYAIEGCPTLGDYFCTNMGGMNANDLTCRKRNDVPVKSVEKELELCY